MIKSSGHVFLQEVIMRNEGHGRINYQFVCLLVRRTWGTLRATPPTASAGQNELLPSQVHMYG